MKKLFSRYTIIFILVISFYAVGNWWASISAQPIDSNTVTIFRAGIKKYDYTSGNLDYIGENVNSDAADDDTDWTIYKVTWSSGEVIIIQKKEGSWTGRDALFL